MSTEFKFSRTGDEQRVARIALVVVDIGGGGGVETVTLRLRDCLRHADHEVVVVSCRGDERSSNSDVVYLGIHGSTFRPSDVERFLLLLEKERVNHVVYQLNGPLCLLASISLYRAVGPVASQYIVVHNSPRSFVRRHYDPTQSPVLWILRWIRTQLILAPRARKFFHESSRAVDAIVTLSEGTQKEMLRVFGVESVVVPNQPDTSAPDRDEHRKVRRVSYVGRFDFAQKNLYFLLRAWKRIPDYSGWEFVLVGRENAKRLERFIRRNQIPNVRIVPGLSQEEALEFMSESSVMVLASKYEGFPTVFVEGMLRSNVFVATSFDGRSDELLQTGVTGFWTGFSVREFSSRLKQLVSNDDLRIAMQTNARKRAELYRKTDVVGMWNRLFEAAASAKTPHP